MEPPEKESTKSPLLVVQYLRENGLDSLRKHFSIEMVGHQKYDNLVLLKYSQKFSSFSDPIVQECRGLIVDEDVGLPLNHRMTGNPYRCHFDGFLTTTNLIRTCN